MAWVAKVGRRVVYLQQKTVNGNTVYVKRLPAQITAIASDGAPVLKLTGSGTVIGNATNGALRKTHSTGNSQVSRYVSW